MLKRKTEISPERSELARCILEASQAEANRNELRKALEIAEQNVSNLRDAVLGARDAVTEAAEAAVAHMTDQARGVSGPEPISVQDANAALERAESRLEFAKAARDTLRQRFNDAMERPRYEADRVRDAALAVLRAEAADAAKALADEVIELQKSLIGKSIALRWLVQHAILPVIDEIGSMRGRAADESVSNALSRMDMPVPAWTHATCGILHPNRLPDQHGAAGWQANLEALMADAAAPLAGLA